MRKISLVYGIALALFVVACSRYDHSVDIADVREADIIMLSNSHTTEAVHAINIHCSGNIDGDAVISLMLNGAPYKTERLNNTVDFNWNGDWYSDTAEIHYSPTSVNSGKLVIEYTFSAL